MRPRKGRKAGSLRFECVRCVLLDLVPEFRMQKRTL